MSDVRAMFDDIHVKAWDLEGKDRIVTIEKVTAGELKDKSGKSSKKPIVHLAGKSKGLVLNKTNMKTVAAMYGYDTRAWAGQKIIIYPTTTSMGGETVDCIRVRPRVPGNALQKNGAMRPDPRDGVWPPQPAQPPPGVVPSMTSQDDVETDDEDSDQSDAAEPEMTDEDRLAAIDAGHL